LVVPHKYPATAKRKAKCRVNGKRLRFGDYGDNAMRLEHTLRHNSFGAVKETRRLDEIYHGGILAYLHDKQKRRAAARRFRIIVQKTP